MIRPETFEGLWRVSRSIADRQSGLPGRFAGEARFRPEGTGRLIYEEAGRLTLGESPPFEARRVYVWVFAGDLVEVLFDDGRPFHRFRPEGEGPGTDHPCGADFYRVQYDFTLWPRWRTVWTVTGPRKDYTMTTDYAPAEG